MMTLWHGRSRVRIETGRKSEREVDELSLPFQVAATACPCQDPTAQT